MISPNNERLTYINAPKETALCFLIISQPHKLSSMGSIAFDQRRSVLLKVGGVKRLNVD